MDHELAPGPAPPTAVALRGSCAGCPGHTPALSGPPRHRRSPRLEKPQGCRAVEGGASPCCGIPSLSESFHGEKCQICQRLHQDFFFPFLCLSFTLLRFVAWPCGPLEARNQRVSVWGGHSAHVCRQTDRRRCTQGPVDTCTLGSQALSSCFAFWDFKTLSVRPTPHSPPLPFLLPARFPVSNSSFPL